MSIDREQIDLYEIANFSLEILAKTKTKLQLKLVFVNKLYLNVILNQLFFGHS